MVKIVNAMVLSATCFIASGWVQANDVQVGSLKIEQAWVREVPPTASNTAGYLQIVNSGAADHLLSVQSGVAKATEMHEMKMDKGVMQMNKLPCVIIPANKTVSFAPGGMHLMFIELKQPLKAGDEVEVTLEFEKAGNVSLKLPVVKKN